MDREMGRADRQRRGRAPLGQAHPPLVAISDRRTIGQPTSGRTGLGQAELASGRGLGETVSFPVEELSDWAYLLQGRIDGEHDGGFTVELFERRYGQPD